MKAISLFLVLFCLGNTVFAQEKLVDYHIECPRHLILGDTLQFVVKLDVQEGYHINAPGYFGDSGAFPTDLEFITPLPQGLTKLGNAKMLDSEGNAYGSQAEGNEIRLVQLFIYDKKAPHKELLIKGSLNYQVCDLQSCHAPVNIPFESKIQISTKKGK